MLGFLGAATLLPGAERSQLLSPEKVTQLWIPPSPSLLFPVDQSSHSPAPPPASQFLSEVIYSTIMSLSPTPPSLTLPFSPSAPPRPLDPSRELLILSALQISTLFSRPGMPTPLQRLLLAPLTRLFLQATPFFTLAQPHRLAGAFREA